MIVAAFVLLAIGTSDLVRRFVSARARWAALGAAAVVILLLGALSAAILPAVAGVLVAAGWILLFPLDAPPRAGILPAVAVGVICVAAVAVWDARPGAGVVGAVWHLPPPLGDLPFDRALLVVGVVVFLLESANVVVRVALIGERVAGVGRSAAASSAAEAAQRAEGDDAEANAGDALDTSATRSAAVDPSLAAAPDAPVPAVLKGGRLIGPLERLLVMALTLAGAYALVAAFVAAKGIVRFPEISRDGATGNRAEYFLVGSMVSWVLALGGALLVWWA